MAGSSCNEFVNPGWKVRGLCFSGRTSSLKALLGGIRRSPHQPKSPNKGPRYLNSQPPGDGHGLLTLVLHILCRTQKQIGRGPSPVILAPLANEEQSPTAIAAMTLVAPSCFRIGFCRALRLPMKEVFRYSVVAVQGRRAVISLVLLNRDEEQIESAFLMKVDSFANTVGRFWSEHPERSKYFRQAVVTMDLKRDSGQLSQWPGPMVNALTQHRNEFLKLLTHQRCRPEVPEFFYDGAA